MNSTMKTEETRFTFGFCSQFITGFVILISFFLLGSNDFTCPLAFLYLTRTDRVSRFFHFLSCLLYVKINIILEIMGEGGDADSRQRAWMEGRRGIWSGQYVNQ